MLLQKTRIEALLNLLEGVGITGFGILYRLSNEAKELSKVLKHNGFVVNLLHVRIAVFLKNLLK